jgi:FkbM family methyltransferase
VPPPRKLFLTILGHIPAKVASLFKSTSRTARLFRPLVNRLVVSELVPLRIQSGPAKDLKILLNPHSEKYYWTGTYERDVQEYLASTLRDRDVFWDIGAHGGFFTLLASRLVGIQGQVIAFEPAIDNRLRLCRSLELNRTTNVEVLGYAVSAKDGPAPLYAHRESSMRSLVRARTTDAADEVECRTLDSLGKVYPIPDLVKVDVEGAELDVLRGGQELIASHRPAIVVEFSDPSLLDEGRTFLRSEYSFRRLGPTQWLLTPVENH